MKATRAAQSSIDVSNLSIPDAEEIIEEALGELAFSQDPGLVRALRFLAPPGTRQLWNCAVKMAAASAAMPRRIPGLQKKTKYESILERTDEAGASPREIRSPRATAEHSFESEDDSQPAMIPADLEARVKELCAALAEAERGGTPLSR